MTRPIRASTLIGDSRRAAREQMQVTLARPLWANEIVHHIDGNPLNNSLDNLQVVTRQEHRGLHAVLRCQGVSAQPAPKYRRKTNRVEKPLYWTPRRVREFRHGRHWTQTELAEVLGVHQTMVARWETGVTQPRQDNQAKLDRLAGTRAGAI